ncbi:LOW QUALITY PROTEIN: long-chain-fatty-acid--CoA ligase ACSBG2-like [Ruditapes philippinarum]|uniref:LOW QUALITY PROTEIN: long-chain-fatty-acid--CoA ligase ACSBG2-like n=1 Tax=Ruditapes philippinarum TaxID=129788 RepID=UPI00295C3052|nr:LOW QUALITY PROTEIN: long-chain-fatty-acid--CoA ligase ACSBG2-like [Ruditapes philippinarum]
METATVESQQEMTGPEDVKSELTLGDVKLEGVQSSEGIVTPTEAAAAGDINVILDKGDNNMGNNTSAPVVATSIKTVENGSTEKPYSYGDTAVVKKDIDDLLPASSLWTTDMKGTVKLRMGNSGPASVKPTTIPTVFRKTVERLPNHLALAVKRDGEWKQWSYERYYKESQQAAKSFIKLGLEPCHGMGILGFNAPEWYISFIGAIFAGGKATGIYTTNTPEACQYVLEDCQANIVVVENHMQLQKIIKVWDKLPHLKAIIQYTGEVAERRDGIYSWEDFLALSKEVPDSELEKRFMLQAPNTCCSLIYTSGTTGNPKAVMISHDSCTWTAEQTGKQLQYKDGTEISVTFLPLSHIAAQMLDILMPLRFGTSVYFAQPDALKGSLVETLKEVRPTGLLAVPRLWEKFMEKMQAIGAQTTGLKRKFAIWAKAKGKKGAEAQRNGERMPWGWSIANMILFKKIRANLGLDRCRLQGSAAAPIMRETLEYFACLNIRIDECYGMSESSGPHTFCTDQAFSITSVGRELPGVETKLDNPDEDGNGEICFYGRHVFMGYLNQEEKTKEALDEQGWLHSGDVGKKDKDGFLYITGRIKELIITAGGENIAPVPIEDNVKEELKCVSNCMLIGDKRKFLSMLITLKCDMDLDTNEPLNTLSPECVTWCKSIGSSAKTVNEAIADQAMLKAIQAGIDKANDKSVSRAARIQKWSILAADFSIPGGELGPTLKTRRPIVVKKYEKTIEGFYAD